MPYVSDASSLREHEGTWARTHLVRQDRCEVEGVGVDTIPFQIVGARGIPALAATRVGDLVRKGRGDNQEDAGEDAHADW